MKPAMMLVVVGTLAVLALAGWWLMQPEFIGPPGPPLTVEMEFYDENGNRLLPESVELIEEKG